MVSTVGNGGVLLPAQFGIIAERGVDYVKGALISGNLVADS
jgi:hypothetical protein